MKRRSFLAALFAAPSVAAVAKSTGDTSAPFQVDGETVRMNVADIGTISSGVIRSRNGAMAIDIGRGLITIA